jgi:hypothetical protein
MGRRDLIVLSASLVVVVVLVVLTLLAPVYHMPGGGYARHWVWNAPVITVRHGYDDLSPADIERLNKDPRQRAILENMKNQPRSVPSTPIYFGGRRGPGRNVLGNIALISVIAWVALFWYRWSNR